MLCTNCASPAFCKIIACFHTPLIKKGKKNEENLFLHILHKQVSKWIGRVQLWAGRLLLEPSGATGGFSSPKNLGMGQCLGTGAHIKTTVPCRWWQVPLTTSWGRMGCHQKAICMGTEESNSCGWGHSLQLRWQWKAPFSWRTPKCWLQHLGQGKHKGLPSGHLPAQARRQSQRRQMFSNVFTNLGDFLFHLMEDQSPFLGLASQGGLCSERQQKSFFKTHFSVVLLPQGLSEHRVDGGASVWARRWWWCQGLSILATGLMWCLMELMGKKIFFWSYWGFPGVLC